ncbi:hypothetical protein GCM10022251_46840 [Phytohabitans flavus]|uniref:hypothetical protein n=1 Tax=Phytohabitans flavus TaxID=1076124 RepID=UPI0031EACCF2
MDDELTGLEHLLLVAWRQRMDSAVARTRAACLVIGLGLGEVAHRPVRTYAPEARRRLDEALHLMSEEPGRSNGGTGRVREGWAQAVPSTDSPGSARSL